MSGFVNIFIWLECFEIEQQDLILNNITEKTGLKLFIYKNLEENAEFFAFLMGYNEDFVKFAEDFIEDEIMKKQYIMYCQKSRLEKLFKN